MTPGELLIWAGAFNNRLQDGETNYRNMAAAANKATGVIRMLRHLDTAKFDLSDEAQADLLEIRTPVL